jgi:hypothetical protein
MGEYELAVLGVSEVRWNGNGRTETTDGNVFVYWGMANADNDLIRGVEILINKDIRGVLLEWNPVSEWTITAIHNQDKKTIYSTMPCPNKEFRTC